MKGNTGTQLGRLARATLNYGVGSVLPKALGLVLLPIYATYLSPTDFGLVEMVSALTALLIVLMRLGMPGALTRFYFEHREGPGLRDLVSTISTVMVWASGAIGLSAGAVLYLLGDTLLPGVPFWPFVVAGIAGAALAAHSDMQRRLIQAREQSAYSAKLSLATGIVTIVATVILVIGFDLGALGMVLGSLAASAVFLIQARVYLGPELRGSFRREALTASWRYALGVFPSHVIGNVAPLVTRSVLAATGSLAAVGTIGVAARFAAPLAILSAAFNSAYLPVYFSARTDESPDAQRRMEATQQAIWIIGAAVFLVTVVAGPPVIRLLMPAVYAEAGDLLIILAIGFYAQVGYTLVGGEMFYARIPWMVPVVAAAATTVSIVVVVFAAPRFGAAGLAAAQSASSICSTALAAVYAATKRPRSLSVWHTLGVLTATALAWLAARTLPEMRGVEFVPASVLALIALIGVLALVRNPGLVEIHRLVAGRLTA